MFFRTLSLSFVIFWLGTCTAFTASQSSKWVVLTSISYPTEAVKILAAQKGWKVVVVADKKTPADWAYPNVDFLSVEMQQSLPYEIMPLVPYNNYGRKNLGYLWAIQHGAQEVYETDDDNELITADLPTFDGLETYVYNVTNQTVVNPYAYFGYPEIWPRGYPLDQIRASQHSVEHFSRVASKPLILQGLADKDPDVDAIFRLTQPMGINFHKDIPAVVLPEGVMCPFNSQNTLFHNDALWGMLIPITTSFRVCDIWRGYWVQRLLWEVEGNLAFGEPTVDQFRNPHTLMRDFKDEIDLYEKGGQIVDFLVKWRPSPGSDLPTMMVDLAKAMAENNFWEEDDVGFMKAWVNDLKKLEYTFPAVRRSHDYHVPTLAPVDPEHPTPQHWHRHDDIVLVIVFDSALHGWIDTAKMLKKAYAPIFGTVAFTGFGVLENFPKDEIWVGCDPDWHAEHMYTCFGNAVQELAAPPSGGYLFIYYNSLIAHCQIPNFDKGKIWFDHDLTPREADHMAEVKEMAKRNDVVHDVKGVEQLHGVLNQFIEQGNRIGKRLQYRLKGSTRSAHFVSHHADYFYLPARMRTDFAVACTALAPTDLHYRLIVPNVLGLLTNSSADIQVFRSMSLNEDSSPKEEDSTYAVAHPDAFLMPSGLKGGAFIMQNWKLQDMEGSREFWRWWTESYSC